MSAKIWAEWQFGGLLRSMRPRWWEKLVQGYAKRGISLYCQFSRMDDALTITWVYSWIRIFHSGNSHVPTSFYVFSFGSEEVVSIGISSKEVASSDTATFTKSSTLDFRQRFGPQEPQSLGFIIMLLQEVMLFLLEISSDVAVSR